jgi:hypothetical protein
LFRNMRGINTVYVIVLTLHADFNANRVSSSLFDGCEESNAPTTSAQGGFSDYGLQDGAIRRSPAVLPGRTLRTVLVSLVQSSLVPTVRPACVGELASGAKGTAASMRPLPRCLHHRKRTQRALAREYESDGRVTFECQSRHARQAACRQKAPWRDTGDDRVSPHLGTSNSTSSTCAFSRDKRWDRRGRSMALIEEWLPPAFPGCARDLSGEVSVGIVETPRAGRARVTKGVDSWASQEPPPQSRKRSQVECLPLQSVLPRQWRSDLPGALLTKWADIQSPPSRMRRQQCHLRLYESRRWQAAYDVIAGTSFHSQGAQSRTRIGVPRCALLRSVCEKQTRHTQPGPSPAWATTGETSDPTQRRCLLGPAARNQSIEMPSMRSRAGGSTYRCSRWGATTMSARIPCNLIVFCHRTAIGLFRLLYFPVLLKSTAFFSPLVALGGSENWANQPLAGATRRAQKPKQRSPLQRCPTKPLKLTLAAPTMVLLAPLAAEATPSANAA